MVWNRRKITWEEQPQVPTEINWLHPASKGLTHLFIFNTSNTDKVLNLVNGKFYTYTKQSGTVGAKVDEHGRAIQFNDLDGGIDLGIEGESVSTTLSVFGAVRYDNDLQDHELFDCNSQKPILWADTLSSSLRLIAYSGAAQAGTAGALGGGGKQVWGARLVSGSTTDNYFFENGTGISKGSIGTWSPSSTNFVLGSSKAIATKVTEGSYNWIAFYNGSLVSVSVGEFLTANALNIYQLLQPQTRYLVTAAAISATPPTANLGLTGLAPTITTTANQNIEIPVASLNLTGYAPVITLGGDISIEIPLANLGLTGLIPDILTPVSIEIPVAALTLTGYEPTISTTILINIPLATLTLTGLVPTISAESNQLITVPVATLLLTGYAPDVTGTVLLWTVQSEESTVWTAQAKETTPWTQH